MTKKVEKKTAGLVFKQNSGDYITEVFGLDHEKYHKIVKDIAAFLITTAVAGLYESKTEAFEGYLGSVQFKKQGFSLKTPNDYFILGYMFNHAMEFQREFEKLLDETKSRGATVVLSSHVLSEVEHLANRVAIINEGRIVLVDEIASLKAKALRKIEFTFDHQVSEGDFFHLDQVKVLALDHNRVTLEVKGSEKALIAKAAELGATDVRTHESSLDEIFVDLVAKK